MKIYLTVHQWESDIRSTWEERPQWVTALLHEEAPPSTWTSHSCNRSAKEGFSGKSVSQKLKKELRLLNVTNWNYFNKKSSCFKNKD